MRALVSLSIQVSIASAFLAGCTSGAPSGTAIVPNAAPPGSGSTAQLAAGHLGRAVPNGLYKGLKALYVVNRVTDSVDVLSNNRYRDIGALTTGVDNPSAVALDTAGNVYVGNFQGASVTEYAPGATSPLFTYSTGMAQPTGVVVDAHGNVYEADSGNGGVINEYFQGVNARVAFANLPANVFVDGIAVDATGDVFVSYLTSFSNGAAVGEFTGGLNGPFATLPFSIGQVGGIALDKQGNLLVCDDVNNAIDVLAPPYSSVTRTVGSGFLRPDTVALNKANSEVFVTDNSGRVTVVNYATGTNVTTLGTANGVDASAAVDGPDAVY